MVNNSTKLLDNIRRLSWLEHHDVVWVVLVVLLIDFSVHWLQLFVIKFVWQVKAWFIISGGNGWLVQWIKADHILVEREPGTDLVPVGNKLVLKAVVVVIQMLESALSFSCVIEGSEEHSITVFDKWIPIGIKVETEVFLNRLALSKHLKNVSQEWTQNCVLAVDIEVAVLSIKIRESLPTNMPGKHVLMHVNKCVYSVLSKLVDKLLNFVKVSIVINTWGSLDSFPHDAKSHKIHTPALQVLDILVIQRSLWVEFLLAGNVWVHFVNGVHSVENDGTAIFIYELTSFVINSDFGFGS